MFRTALVAGGLVASLTAVGFGQVTLERKFQEGTSYTTESTERTEQKLTIVGMDVDTSSDTKSTTKATVGKRDAEGKLRVQEKIESMTVSMAIMGQNYNFDSANPENKGESPLEILRDVHKALLKRTTTHVYDKFDRVAAVETDVDILNALPAEVQNLAKGQADPERLKAAANEELEQLKSDPLKQGDTWQRTKTNDFGAGQVMTFQNEYTYAGPVEKDGRKLDKVTWKVLSVNFAFENSPLPIALKSSELKAPESEGVILFDRERGQVAETSTSLRITGELTFTANGMDLPSKLDLKMQTTTIVKR